MYAIRSYYDFEDFEKAYNAEHRAKVKDERWNCISREAIAKKNDSLDLGLIRNNFV